MDFTGGISEEVGQGEGQVGNGNSGKEQDEVGDGSATQRSHQRSSGRQHEGGMSGQCQGCPNLYKQYIYRLVSMQL